LNILVGPHFAAEASTVSIPAGDNLGVHLALEKLDPGVVLCVASGGMGRFGVVGELLSEAARKRGAVGLVIDDGIRDISRLTPPPSIVARGVSAEGTIKQRSISLNQPIAIGGVLIEPGDWVIADQDGVCVIPCARLGEVLEAAAGRTEREDAARVKIVAGVSTLELFGPDRIGGQGATRSA
jgi:4-hydroxy-4-methyl-2-oxoglutarate aldolase